jgi:hypothetical protein
MTRSLLASAALYWYLRAHGQDRMSMDTAAEVLGGAPAEVAKLDLDERLHATPKTIRLAGSSSDPAQEVWRYWAKATGRDGRARLTPKSRTTIKARLREGRTVEELCRAVDGCQTSDWHRGEHPRNQQPYNHVKHIFLNADRVAEHIERYELSIRPAPSPTPVDAPAVEWSPPAIQRERFVCWHCGCDDSYPHTPPSGMPGPPVCKACFTHVCDSGALPDVSRETRGLF